MKLYDGNIYVITYEYTSVLDPSTPRLITGQIIRVVEKDSLKAEALALEEIAAKVGASGTDIHIYQTQRQGMADTLVVGDGATV